MLHTKIPHIEKIVEEAIQKASAEKKPRLISVVREVEKTDPFRFFYAGRVIDQHRMFWQCADEPFTLVGIGTVKKIHSSGPKRFQAVQSDWKHMLKDATTYDEHGIKGTGIVSIGGFSFDPSQPLDQPWEAFPDCELTIPSYILTNTDGRSFFSTNLLVYPEDHVGQIVRQLDDEEQQLWDHQHDPFSLPERVKEIEVEPDKWKQSIKTATDNIKAGMLDKVVLARELRVVFKEEVQAVAVLKELAVTQPNSYIFGYECAGDFFVGATPERLAKLENQQLVSTCLAGTTPRGDTEEEDARLGQELLFDPKNRQEHQFVVEMIKAAVEACCHNITIPETPVVYPLKNLQHLYTPVRATLNNGHTLLDVIAKLHPTPALGGWPQKKSVEYIRSHETLNRGWYAGPIGWVDGRDNGEFAVAIRSALLQKKKASLFAGCGVVEDSDPEKEYDETAVKLKPMLSVLGGF